MKGSTWSGLQRFRLSKDLAKMCFSGFRWIVLVVSASHLKSVLLSSCYPTFYFCICVEEHSRTRYNENWSLYSSFPKARGFELRAHLQWVLPLAIPTDVSFDSGTVMFLQYSSLQRSARHKAMPPLGRVFTLPGLSRVSTTARFLAGTPPVPPTCLHLMWPSQALGGNTRSRTWFPSVHPLFASKCGLIVSCLILTIWPQQQVFCASVY